ncbi:radical SAM protein [Polyangium spumosum]|uniref:Radical SAM protein n=2 Tax=Polyangium spumosum TaxID=889282 RepID=A0A6N7Q5P3_9BACT|nr:radical SAM protein [Polyangium spumosum]
MARATMADGSDEGVILAATTGLCRTCKRAVPAETVRVAGEVYLRKHCDEHGPEEVLLSSSADWYEETVRSTSVLERPAAPRPVSAGCPYDCGPCEQHEQRNHLPVVPITSKCDLDCPICYTHNKNEGAYHMSEEELAAILRHLDHVAPDRRIINLTGGEPTQHPDFERLVEMCVSAGVRRVTVSTHGLRFLRDEALLERLARKGARVILSFDSFEPEANKKMLGGHHLNAKLRILELLEKHGVPTTLLPVLARGVNDHEVSAFIDLALSKDFIRSVEFHPMTFTGQSGASFERSARYTAFDALSDIERQSGGRIVVRDFVPSPLAHPLCYQIAYLLRLKDGRWLPFTRFMSREDLRSLLSQELYIVPGPEMEQILADVLNRLWAGDIECEETDAVLSALKDLVERMFAPGTDEAIRMRIAESHTKAIYVHTHMDEETFDTDRIRRCCVGMPGPDGSNVPSCAYNVLYRERDARFSPRPAAPLVQLGRGRTR